MPAQQVVLDDNDPTVMAYADEAMRALKAYLSDTSMERKIEPGSAGENLISAGQFSGLARLFERKDAPTRAAVPVVFPPGEALRVPGI